jgi:hypothetical protein
MPTKETTTPTAHAEIVRTALDYFEGWFDGDVARMDRALSPELAKRHADLEETLTKHWMVEATAAGRGKQRDPDGDRHIAVEVVDVHGDIATAVIRSAVYHEYIHLARAADGWKIVNALWDWT